MGLYNPLNHYFSESGQEIVQMPFSEIEKLLGRVLPQSAYTNGSIPCKAEQEIL